MRRQRRIFDLHVHVESVRAPGGRDARAVVARHRALAVPALRRDRDRHQTAIDLTVDVRRRGQGRQVIAIVGDACSRAGAGPRVARVGAGVIGLRRLAAGVFLTARVALVRCHRVATAARTRAAASRWRPCVHMARRRLAACVARAGVTLASRGKQRLVIKSATAERADQYGCGKRDGCGKRAGAPLPPDDCTPASTRHLRSLIPSLRGKGSPGTEWTHTCAGATPPSHVAMATERTPKGEAALTRASEEQGLQLEYRDCVRPLLNMPTSQWPTCCGRGCEPCSETLVTVARRVRELLEG